MIERTLTGRESENYIWLIKTLSKAGFVWDGAMVWRRQRDDAVVSDESLQDVVTSWPALVPQIAAAFEAGAGEFKVTIGPPLVVDVNRPSQRSWTVSFEAR